MTWRVLMQRVRRPLHWTWSRENMNKYRDHATRESHQWSVARYDEVRDKVIDLILQLYEL